MSAHRRKGRKTKSPRGGCGVPSDSNQPSSHLFLCFRATFLSNRIQDLTLEVYTRAVQKGRCAANRVSAKHGNYSFCSARDCSTVYFEGERGEQFTLNDLRIRVGLKVNDDP